MRLLQEYSFFINSNVNKEYFIKLADDIEKENAKVIIGKQWKDVNSAEDGKRSFIETFGEIFEKTINMRKEGFFHPLSNTDILCRAVEGCRQEFSFI